ncbi:voltage-dependent calcium channel gamma-3 subunit [Platysternon megacephalum]|uniref:Voltage-dependent calcium channel gamma-3 subunit n=1 Tax=Platysternon megacephalum TaxID=55544 RepID=A0A4D9EK27_9SAUR|nr:voltage-dependent calcium channel gamma-3 subunit [Platysternon megacephalum]
MGPVGLTLAHELLSPLLRVFPRSHLCSGSSHCQEGASPQLSPGVPGSSPQPSSRVMRLLAVQAVVALCVLHLPLSSSQDCLSKRQVLSTIQQMQKLLSTQEAAQLQGMRSLKKQLTVLQSNIHKQATGHNDSCPPLTAPRNGRKLGKKATVGHEAHFLCEAGFRLVGSESRTCLQDRTWSGQQPVCRSISHCTSSPCANGGTCVEDVQRFTCLCPSSWSGRNCQTPVYSYWVTLSNSSFSRQPRCADTRLGSRRCACDTGFRLRAGGVCQDVDECQLPQASWQTRLCAHDCVNLPGSYRCVCPRGYLRPADQNLCTDVDECADNQHNCSHGELCVNVFGGYRCVRPECPKPRLNTSYVKTSVYRACRLAANSISFHYLLLQSNRTVPRVLFKMSTTHLVGESLRFAITGGRGQAVFAVRRSDRHTGELILTSPVVGPATLEVELEMSKLAQKVLLGKHIFRVTAFISQYEF